MIITQMNLEPGFHKADVNSIPVIRNEAMYAYIANVSSSGKSSQKVVPSFIRPAKDSDLKVDYVQVRRIAEITDLKALVFSDSMAMYSAADEAQVRVSIKVDTKREEILDCSCAQCTGKKSCYHILALIFWLHRISNTDIPIVHDFWGHETEALLEEVRSEPIRIRDFFASDDLRIECDMEAAAMTDLEGAAFLEHVLDEMEGTGLRDSAFYRHCRGVLDEFEPLYIHHTLLDASNNGVKDVNTFNQHMEDQAKQGLFDRLGEISKSNYKSMMWLEAQYMRLRCSLIHRIASRKDAIEDEQIMESLFCKNRDINAEEKQQLKQHKRFILKQTEKLENKTYQECGLLLSESYPYICAAPDGITDNHIVEIKAPKTDEEFEKYLEGRETIAPKYMAQIQIQMYMANVTKALYCVLSPTFDTNGALHYVWVQADMEFVASLLSAAEDFWKEVVFPRLVKIYFNNS